MSTNVTDLDKELNAEILKGNILGAFEQYYADDVVMMENDVPFAGKEVNRAREEEFVGKVEAIHSGEVVASAVSGDVTFSEWKMDITFKGGHRVTMEQVAVRHWQNGKIVKERFYYKG